MFMQLIDLNCEGLEESFAYEVDDYNTVCNKGPLNSTEKNDPDQTHLSRHRSFDSIFSDDKTREVFNRLLSHTRNSRDVVSFPYRCDTEKKCHYYRLIVSISSARHVLFFNKLLASDARQNGVRWLRSKSLSPDASNVCSICNRILFAQRWVEFQELVDASLWPADNSEMSCSYTVCSQCERGINQRISESLNSS